jgi:hypothetical protein
MDLTLISYNLHFAFIGVRHIRPYYSDLEERIIQNDFTPNVLHLHIAIAVNQADYLHYNYHSQNIRTR